jgi:hypothetical protein
VIYTHSLSHLIQQVIDVDEDSKYRPVDLRIIKKDSGVLKDYEVLGGASAYFMFTVY